MSPRRLRGVIAEEQEIAAKYKAYDRFAAHVRVKDSEGEGR